jgi:hypothetical protein
MKLGLPGAPFIGINFVSRAGFGLQQEDASKFGYSPARLGFEIGNGFVLIWGKVSFSVSADDGRKKGCGAGLCRGRLLNAQWCRLRVEGKGRGIGGPASLGFGPKRV